MKRIISFVLSLLLVSAIISTGMVASASSTVQDNYDALKSYVNAYGEQTSSTIVSVGFTEKNGSTENRFQIRSTSSGIELVLNVKGSALTRYDSSTTITLTRSSSDAKLSEYLYYYNKGSLTDMMNGSTTISRSNLSSSKTYSITGSGTGSIITQSMFSESFNTALKTLCSALDKYIYAELGFGLKGLGFTSYSGLGSAACDPSSSKHSGETEIRNAVAATCSKDGYSGDTYCKTCGEKLRSGSVISSTSHNYNKEVATDNYLESKATCTVAAKYYKSCECGAKGTATFTYGKALGHAESDWLSDSDNHWKECLADGCKVIINNSKAAHNDSNNDGKCDACAYNVGIAPIEPEPIEPEPIEPEPIEPEPIEPENPETGNNGINCIYIVLMLVSGFFVTITVLKKRFVK